MPANLPPEAQAKWAKYLEAKTKEEKLRALQEYLSAIPKHKGTENLVKQVRRKIAKLRREIEEERVRRRRRGGGAGYAVSKEGDVQLAVVGLPNSGKSFLVSKLTNAKTVVSPRPLSTVYPVPGMYIYRGVQIQLVDTPSLIPGDTSRWNSKVLLLVRNADGVLLVLNAEHDVRGQFEAVAKMLREAGIILGKPRFRLRVERGPFQQPQIILNGVIEDGTPEDLRRMLLDYGMSNVRVVIDGEATMDMIEDALSGSHVYKPAILILNRCGGDCGALAKELSGETGLPVLTLTTKGLEGFGETVLRELGLIRIYTKEPGERPSERPLVLPRGSTVQDVAARIHRKFVERFRYARVWGPSVRYPGSRVGLDHVLEDGDVVEIYAY